VVLKGLRRVIDELRRLNRFWRRTRCNLQPLYLGSSIRLFLYECVRRIKTPEE
jgi:hypothetical protein